MCETTVIVRTRTTPIPHESQHIEHKPENNMTCDWGIHGTCAEYK